MWINALKRLSKTQAAKSEKAFSVIDFCKSESQPESGSLKKEDCSLFDGYLACVFARLSVLLDEPFLEDVSFRATVSADFFEQLRIEAVRHLLESALD